MQIFVQIAAYRDPELLPTIRHCLSRAKNPESLTFGICWQHDENESIEEFQDDPRFRIIKVDYKESKGACWARSKTNNLYKGEEFTLQIDSHMRFIENWDEVLLNMWNELKDPRAILTAYPPQYEPGQTDDKWLKVPHICNVYGFRDDQTEQRPNAFPDIDTRTTPYKAVHIAAGFLFGSGSIIEDVPYDPEFYFLGEETAMTVRLFTNGYNLFHPHKTILYHYYERKEENKHWVDYKDWSTLGFVSNDRLNCLLGRNQKYDLGKYGLGTKRSIRDFQNYSGIDYARKIVHTDTVEGKEPPVDLTDILKWSYSIKKFDLAIRWVFEEVDKCDDPRFWAFIFKDLNGQEVHREDITFEQHPEIISGKVFERRFNFSYYYPMQLPSCFMIWPYSQSKGWIKSSTWQLS